MTFTRALSTNNYGPAKFIVDGTTIANGTHSTIAAALTSASSGDTIFIRPGTYTENLTLKAGVSLAAYDADALTPNVTISGTCTFTGAGTVSLSGIRLQTNGSFLLTVSGSSASIVWLKDCFLNCTNNTGISFTSSSSSATINVLQCNGDITTTGIAMFSMSSAGSMNITTTEWKNTGASVTASTASAGTILAQYCRFFSPITTSGTNGFGTNNSAFSCSAINTTALTIGGSGTNSIDLSRINSGTASCVSIGATCEILHTSIESSNTNAITGAGTLRYSSIDFNSTSSTINTTTLTPLVTRFAQQRSTTQPAFLAYLATTALNKTGNGATYTIGTDALTEVFDQNSNFNTNGTFTAPVTGRYFLQYTVNLTGGTTTAALVATMITTNRSYINTSNFTGSAGGVFSVISVVADMTAGDTATYTVQAFGNVGDTVDILGGASCNTYVSGYLLC